MSAGLAAAALLLVALPLHSPAADRLSPERLRWSELRYRARKLIFTAETRVRAEVIPATAARELVAATGHEPVAAAGEELVRVEIDTELFGRHSHNTVLLDPASGAALQSTSRESGKRARLKTQRFTADGIAVRRLRPAAGEESLPAARWSRSSEELLAFSPAAAGAAAISDSVALFWILATAPLERPGDRFGVRLVSGGRVVQVGIKVLALTWARLDAIERQDGTERRLAAPVTVLELLVDAERGDAAGAGSDFEFLGMRGGVRILLDSVRRVPVEVSGRVPTAGAITVRLYDVTLLP